MGCIVIGLHLADSHFMPISFGPISRCLKWSNRQRLEPICPLPHPPRQIMVPTLPLAWVLPVIVERLFWLRPICCWDRWGSYTGREWGLSHTFYRIFCLISLLSMSVSTHWLNLVPLIPFKVEHLKWERRALIESELVGKLFYLPNCLRLGKCGKHHL